MWCHGDRYQGSSKMLVPKNAIILILVPVRTSDLGFENGGTMNWSWLEHLVHSPEKEWRYTYHPDSEPALFPAQNTSMWYLIEMSLVYCKIFIWSRDMNYKTFFNVRVVRINLISVLCSLKKVGWRAIDSDNVKTMRPWWCSEFSSNPGCSLWRELFHWLVCQLDASLSTDKDF